MSKKSTFYKSHSDSEMFDQVIFETQLGAIIQAIIFPRYKTSGMSGDEWRISAGWQQKRGEKWVDFDRGYRNLETAAKALYPGLFTSHRDLHDISITHIDFYKKGHKLYEASYDGKSLKLLHAAGHLPWALIIAQENCEHINTNEYCFQPGCSQKAISTYKIIWEYGRQGEKIIQRDSIDLLRRFCKRHLRRGDCGLEDADSNYIVVDGPGPDEAEGWEDYESKAKFGGVINLSGDKD
jgi:hypothetical protein